MDKLHDSIAWYQKQIGSYDKQLWEQSVEKKLLKTPANVHYAPRKIFRQKTEFIDVDLIRGSTFSKTKPQVPWTYITRKALIRVFLLPFCFRWWIQQTSIYFFAILLFLYSFQVMTLFIYCGNVGENIRQDELALSEVFFPIIITLILGLIHSQTVLSHYSHKPPTRDLKHTRNISKTKKRVKQENDSSRNPESARSQEIPGGAFPSESSSNILHEGDEVDVRATVSISNRRDLSFQEDNSPNRESSVQKMNTASSAVFRGQNMTEDLSLKGNNSTRGFAVKGHNSTEDLLLRGENSVRVRGCDNVNTQGIVKGKNGNRKSDLEKSLNAAEGQSAISDSKQSKIRKLKLGVARRKDLILTFEQGQRKFNQNKLQSSSKGSNDKFELLNLQHTFNKDADTDLFDASHWMPKGSFEFGSSLKEEDHFADTERCSDDTNCIQSDLEENDENDINEDTEGNDPQGQVLLTSSQASVVVCSEDDAGKRQNIRRRHPSSTKVRRRFTSLTTEDFNEISDSECMDEEVEQTGANYRHKRRLSATRSADLGEVARLRVNAPNKLAFLSEQRLNQRGSSSDDPAQLTPDGNTVGNGVSSEEWEDRIQSDVTTSSSYSTSCESANEISEGEEVEDLNDPHQGWTSTSINAINLLQPPITSNIGVSHMAPPDKVSCVIWEGNECKKVDLTALDIGWAIIDKVDNLPESSDCIMIGICFSILIGCVPLAFRAYHAKEIPSILSNSFFIKILQLMVNPSWRRNLVMLNGILQRLCLSLIFFFLLSVADRTFKQRLLYAKHFCYLTSSRRARKFDMPHFRLSKVRNIKTWLSLRSYLKRRGPQRSVDVIVSATFLTTISLVSLMCLQMLKDTDTYLDFLCNWELIVWCLCLGVYLLRFMTLGLKINKKYRNLSVLITEQINLYLQMEQKPHKKEELVLANNVLKLAEDLLKELESPFKISGFSANPFIYNMTKVVVLSAFSTVLTELLGFKLKLYKIKFKA